MHTCGRRRRRRYRLTQPAGPHPNHLSLLLARHHRPWPSQDSAAFLKQHWEQAPAVFKASAARRGLFAGLFTYADLQQLAVICEQEGELLEFGVDVNAARYVDGKRETPNGEVRGWQGRRH